MIKLTRMLFVLGILTLLAVGVSYATVTVSQKAPNFKAVDVEGKFVKLSDYKGKFVVLEWFNPECPFVKKHYGSGNMQKLQADYTAKGVVWLSICSSAPGKQGYYSSKDLAEKMAGMGSKATAIIHDATGTVGHLYEAKTTPHMFIVDPQGVLIYHGAIDNMPSTDPADIAGAKNYVAAALDSAMEGKPVETAATKSYGCSVKY